ncbi:MAG: flagellar hook-basal body complex protein [Hyphomicrobiales bacterium]
MENALLVGLSRQITLQRNLEVIANNVANMNTTGFKARTVNFEEFVSPTARADTLPRTNRRVSYVTDQGTDLDLSNGAVEQTGNPLDIALRENNLLAVQTESGFRYTRNGSLSLNEVGTLVTSDGERVLVGGGSITINPGTTGVSIAADGTIESADGPLGRLQIVEVTDPSQLNNLGANVYGSQTQLPVAILPKIIPGALERSNVQPILEMSRLIEVNRAYASLASMQQRLDETRRSAVERLATVQ